MMCSDQIVQVFSQAGYLISSFKCLLHGDACCLEGVGQQTAGLPL